MAEAIVASPVDAHKQTSQSTNQFPTVTVTTSGPQVSVNHYPIPSEWMTRDRPRECVILEHPSVFAAQVRDAKDRAIPLLVSHDGVTYSARVFAALHSTIEVSASDVEVVR